MTDIPDEQSSAWADAADETHQAVKLFMAGKLLAPLLKKGDLLAIQAACIGGIVGICGMMRDMLDPRGHAIIEKMVVSYCRAELRGEPYPAGPEESDKPDDDNLRFSGFVPAGDADRPVDQAELARSDAMFGPIVRAVASLPRDAQACAIGSIVVSYCISTDQPERSLAALFDEFAKILPSMIEQAEATRQ